MLLASLMNGFNRHRRAQASLSLEHHHDLYGQLLLRQFRYEDRVYSGLSAAQ